MLQQAGQIGLVHTVAECQAAQLQELVVVDERVALRLGAITPSASDLQSGTRQEDQRNPKPRSTQCSNLLYICLDAARHAHVYDSANVALVKAHAKRHGGHHYSDFVVLKLHLHL